MEAGGAHAGDEFGDGDVAVGVVVEFDAGDLVGCGGDRGGGFEDGVGGEGWGLRGRLAVGGWWCHYGGWCWVMESIFLILKLKSNENKTFFLVADLDIVAQTQNLVVPTT